ncbi:hypothetical protein BVX98_07715 [bacterium F11]|nr:hypothetical protein BVX98_07715 [bacterium F11]
MFLVEDRRENLIYKAMKMGQRILILTFLCLLIVSGRISADKVTLKEGKVLHGRIISESEDEVMMILGTNMTLRVNKSKIKEINRKKKPKVKKNVVTMDDLKTPEEDKKKEENRKETKGKLTKKKPSVDIARIHPGRQYRVIEKRNVGIEETRQSVNYVVKGDSFQDIHDQIHSKEGGRGFLVSGGRTASQTKMKATWSANLTFEAERSRWVNIVIKATMTTTYPSWDPPPKVKDEEKGKWKKFLDDVVDHEKGHMDIFSRALAQAGESLEGLRCQNASELQKKSKQIFGESLRKAEKQQKGYDRRQRRKKKHSRIKRPRKKALK